MDKNWKPVPPESWMMDECGGSDVDSIDPGQQPNQRSISELSSRWRWIRKDVQRCG